MFDVEGRKASSERFSHNERRSSWGDDRTIGNDNVFCNDSRRAIRIDCDEPPAGGRNRRKRTDIGAAVLVDDHVIAPIYEEGCQVGVRRQICAIPAEDLRFEHRDDQQITIREKSEARRPSAGKVNRFGSIAGQIDGPYGLAVHVRKPQETIPPARALAKDEVVGQELRLLRC